MLIMLNTICQANFSISGNSFNIPALAHSYIVVFVVAVELQSSF